jgi:hypothetical protein
METTQMIPQVVQRKMHGRRLSFSLHLPHTRTYTPPLGPEQVGANTNRGTSNT